MSNPTSNFGWQMPTPTDLVTDLPADFEVFGQAVDSDFADLLGGTTGQILSKTSATDLDFTWVSPAGGGKVLQVVQGIKTGTATTSSTSFSDTGITATITPSSATSKILAFVNVNNCRKAGGNANSGIRMILLRGATTIYNMGSIIAYTNTTGQNDCGSIDGVYLDSPATTSATTYKVQFASNFAGTSIDINNYNSVDDTSSTITLLEIGA